MGLAMGTGGFSYMYNVLGFLNVEICSSWVAGKCVYYIICISLYI